MTLGEKFYIGLDIGTDSCGWACTDENYNLLHLKGKDAWGAFLFDAANTAEKRRVFRSTRRREARRRERIRLLKEIFAVELTKKDPNFFIRLRESRLFSEDKSSPIQNDPFFLFNDPEFTDKDFHKAFPTIFHLRKALIDDDPKAFSDIRLLYLAVHHIIKYRGNFIKEGQSLGNELTSVDEAVKSLKQIQTIYDENPTDDGVVHLIFGDEAKTKQIAAVIKKSKSVSQCQRTLEEEGLAPTEKTDLSIFKAYISLFMGGKKKVSLLIPEIDCGENDFSFTFNDQKYETEICQQVEVLTGTFMKAVENAKQIYDWKVLDGILGGHTFLSDSMVAAYESHKEDLRSLKSLLKPYPDLYRNMFYLPNGKQSKDDKKANANYCYYVGHGCRVGKTIYDVRKCNREDFLKFVKKTLDLLKDEDKISEKYLQIMKRVEEKTFLETPFSISSSIIPYQVHEAELKLILFNAEKHFSFLGEEDSDGLTPSGKIMMLLKFRVPYYVGPLNPKAKGPEIVKGGRSANQNKYFGWAVRRSFEKITPWNFDKVIDKEKSAEGFIRRLTNACTYLPNENVLPENSLLYSEYLVLSELNDTKINGERITKDIRDLLFEKVFKVAKSVSVTRIVTELKKSGFQIEKDSILLRNRKEKFDSSLSSYIDFKKICDEGGFNLEDNRPFIERAIFLSTCYGEPVMLKKTLTAEFKDKVPEKLIEKASKLIFKGWGSFSKAFLDGSNGGPVYFDEAGVVHSIISLMRETPMNLNEIMKTYGMIDKINKINNQEGEDDVVGYDDVRMLYASPAVKRGVWQSLKIVKELSKVAKKVPDKIFVEVTRENLDEEAKKKLDKGSRKDQLLKLYHDCLKNADDQRDLNRLLTELESKTDDDLRGAELYFYFTQLGRDMYSGESIHIDDLSSNYDIDHIIPQSLKKDDSLSNRCLVSNITNQKIKKDTYPLKPEVQNEMRSFWKKLLERGLISKEKFAVLTRTTPLSLDEEADFIARQLVETNQTCDAVIKLLKRMYPETKIVYSKAKNVSAFRQKYDLIKVRNINDLHHANDAYLNIVVGNSLDTKYGSDFYKFVEKRHEKIATGSAKMMQNFDYEIPGAWSVDKNTSISIVKKTMDKHSPLIVRMAKVNTGDFYEMNLVNHNEAFVPMCERESNPLNNLKRYGGYRSGATACFVLIEEGATNKRRRLIVPIRVLDYERCKNKQEYLRKTLSIKFKNPVVNKKVGFIPTNAHLLVKGCSALLCGTSLGSLLISPFVQPFYSINEMRYIKLLYKFLDKAKVQHPGGYLKLPDVPNLVISVNKDGKNVLSLSKEKNCNLFGVLVSKLKSKPYEGLSMSKSADKISIAGEKFFPGLTIYEQIFTLVEIITLLSTAKGDADLNKLELGSRVGNMSISPETKGLFLVNESPTGLFSFTKKL